MYAKKLQARKKSCDVCGTTLELRQGVCKPCWTARGCAVKGCVWLDRNSGAAFCTQCTRTAVGARSARTVMTCPEHTSEEQRHSGLCYICYEENRVCHHCGDKQNVLQTRRSCSQANCTARFFLCTNCNGISQGQQKVLCKACWRANGKICTYCKRSC